MGCAGGSVGAGSDLVCVCILAPPRDLARADLLEAQKTRPVGRHGEEDASSSDGFGLDTCTTTPSLNARESRPLLYRGIGPAGLSRSGSGRLPPPPPEMMSLSSMASSSSKSSPNSKTGAEKVSREPTIELRA